MTQNCLVCHRPSASKFAKYCEYGCGKLMNRANGGKKEERQARRNAVLNAWVDGAIRCHYSGIELEIFDFTSPFYFTFDHATPRSGGDIVGCAQILNDMKTDMTEDEFKHNVIKLAHCFNTGKRLRPTDFKVQHFSRNHTKKK